MTRSPMKTLACSLIAIVSVALSSALFAANLEEDQITGTVVDAEAITIDTAKASAGISSAILIRSRLNY